MSSTVLARSVRVASTESRVRRSTFDRASPVVASMMPTVISMGRMRSAMGSFWITFGVMRVILIRDVV